MVQPDTSTIDRVKLGKLPTYTLPPTYRLSDGIGSACAGDPPGYPTYFTKHVYTQHGNSPGRQGQPTMMLLGHVVERNFEDYEKVKARLHRLWVPLPYEHERVQAWVRSTYQHHARCYYHTDYMEHGKPKTLTAPSIYSSEFRTRTFTDDARFSEEWRTAEKAAIDQYNAEVQARWQAIATPENSAAYQIVKRYYPEHTPNLELIANPPKEHEGSWWEVYAERPTPETCPGKTQQWGRGTMGNLKHPLNGKWCQVCGWHAPEEEGEAAAS